MRLTMSAVLLSLAVAACGRAPAGAPTPVAAQAPASLAQPGDEADVQSVIVASFIGSLTKRLVIVDSTVLGSDHYVDEDYAGALKELGTLPKGLVQDFGRKRHKAPVGAVRASVPIVFVSEQHLRDLGGADPGEYWQRFFDRYPGAFGRLSLSRVGFSSDGRHALTLVDYGCGGRCGGTRYYLLERTATSWRIVRMVQPRIS